MDIPDPVDTYVIGVVLLSLLLKENFTQIIFFFISL